MSLENEERRSSDEGAGDFDLVLKKPKITYAKEFLLSISNLDICKKLPNDFNESLLSEFEYAIWTTLDQPRIPGSSLLQGFKRNEYGSSPPTRGDSANYTRSSYGRWESRSSGRSDRDSDSQSDLESDSGRYSLQNRRSWQNTEKDGLLGSGSFSRPPGYSSGASAPKARASDNYQLNKSKQPYQPPRPYKAVPYSKRETDAYNDETFGSTECTNEDRAEEERRRRASFELIRKEQQKALQEKQKLNLGKNITADLSSLSGVFDVKNDEQGHISHTSGLDISSGTLASNHDFDKSLPSHTLASRPLVPPGFKSNLLEKSIAAGHPTHHLLLEEANHVKGEKHLDPKFDLLQNANIDGLEQSLSQEISSVKGQPSEKTSLLDKLENVKSQKILGTPIRNSDIENHLHGASCLLASHGTSDDTEIVELDVGFENNTEADANRSLSTSILEKIFGSSLSMNDDVSSVTKHVDSKHEDTWSSNSVQSSKFAQWFVEEEAKPVDLIPSKGQNDLLSLIVSGNKGTHQVSESEASKELLYNLSSNTLEHTEIPMHDFPSLVNGVAHQEPKDKKSVATVLTCEDLEQSILTEYNAKTGNSQPLLEGWSTADSNTEKPSERIDDQASLNLLSLLQKGKFQSTMPVNSSVGVDSEHNLGTSVNEHEVEEGSKSIPDSGKTITLEALFGSAFMQELQSVDAPVSVHRGSNGLTGVDTPDSHELHFPVAGKGNIIPSSAVDKNGFQGPNYDPWAMAPNHQQPKKPSKAENWMLYDDSEMGTTSSKHHIDEALKLGGFKGDAELQLPPAMNGDASYHRLTNFMVPQNSMNVNFSSNAPINAITEERVMVSSESQPFPQNVDPKLLYRGVHGQQPSPQFQPPQVVQMRPLHNPMDSHVGHISSQMKYLGPESMFNYDSPINPRFPPPMIQRPFHHQNIGNVGFNVPSHPPMLHHMQMSGNPPHVLPDLPRGDTTSHPGNPMSGFFQEMQGFPMESRQQNISGHGFPIPGGPNMNSGSNPPPEAFQRLIEMELHSKQHQQQQHMQGVYGRELDLGFHYR